VSAALRPRRRRLARRRSRTDAESLPTLAARTRIGTATAVTTDSANRARSLAESPLGVRAIARPTARVERSSHAPITVANTTRVERAR
jgi:hypothetical protein